MAASNNGAKKMVSWSRSVGFLDALKGKRLASLRSKAVRFPQDPVFVLYTAQVVDAGRAWENPWGCSYPSAMQPGRIEERFCRQGERRGAQQDRSYFEDQSSMER